MVPFFGPDTDAYGFPTIRAKNPAPLGESGPDHTLKGLTCSEPIPGALVDHAVQDVVGRCVGRGAELRTVIRAIQSDFHDCPLRSCRWLRIGTRKSYLATSVPFTGYLFGRAADTHDALSNQRFAMVGTIAVYCD
jgi:hypothetical protein